MHPITPKKPVLENGKSSSIGLTAARNFVIYSKIFPSNPDGIVKSPSLAFLLTETEKCDFRFPYKSTGCDAPPLICVPVHGHVDDF
jgi:hypothetical protein